MICLKTLTSTPHLEQAQPQARGSELAVLGQLCLLQDTAGTRAGHVGTEGRESYGHQKLQNATEMEAGAKPLVSKM